MGVEGDFTALGEKRNLNFDESPAPALKLLLATDHDHNSMEIME